MWQQPCDYGSSGNLWDGKTLVAYLQQQWGISLGVRQCQRMFCQLGFRLRKLSAEIARADPFSKMTRSFLRLLCANSKQELRERIEQYLRQVNEDPVVFSSTYRLKDVQVQ